MYSDTQTDHCLGNEALLTEEEAASFLRVNPRTLRKVRDRGEIAFVRIGRCVRYSPKEIKQFVARVTVANQVAGVTNVRTRSAARTSGTVVPFTQIVGR
jgi:excisionase family DNA binding protein